MERKLRTENNPQKKGGDKQWKHVKSYVKRTNTKS